MAIYVYKCNACGHEDEVLLSRAVKALSCSQCRGISPQQPTFPAMVKIKGEGGYPSRRKYLRGTAPYGGSGKAWLDSEPRVK